MFSGSWYASSLCVSAAQNIHAVKHIPFVEARPLSHRAIRPTVHAPRHYPQALRCTKRSSAHDLYMHVILLPRSAAIAHSASRAPGWATREHCATRHEHLAQASSV